MNFDEPDALAYGTQHGAGWRLDCWGDMRVNSNDPYFPAEMLEIYPQQIVRTGIQDVWQRSPVSLETCYTVPGWKERGYDVDYIIAQGLRWHVSTVNIKSSPIPAEWKGKFDEFQKKIGYRFILRRLEYSKTVPSGTMMPVHMWWLNDGIAPDLWRIRSRDGIALRRKNHRAFEFRSMSASGFPATPFTMARFTFLTISRKGTTTYESRCLIQEPASLRFALQTKVVSPTAGTRWAHSR